MILRRLNSTSLVEFFSKGFGMLANRQQGNVFHSTNKLRITYTVINNISIINTNVRWNKNEKVLPLQHQHHYVRHSSSAPKSKVVKFILPDIGEGISEVVIKSWVVKVGNKVAEFDGICEVESDKATVTISSRFCGTIRKIYYDEGATAKVGKPLVDIELADASQSGSFTSVDDDEKSTNVVEKIKDAAAQEVTQQSNERIVSTLPSVRRLSKELSIDLSKVKSSGKNGIVLKEDILNHVKLLEQQKRSSLTNDQRSTFEAGLSANKLRELETRHPMNNVQQAMLKTMTEALKIPHFNYSDEIDVTHLLNGPLTKVKAIDGSRVSLLSIIIKMTSLALSKYPQLNASIDEENKQLVVKNYHNIGVAVDTKNGLLVPNIKNVQKLSVRDINAELLRLRELGYASKLLPIDLTGGTFTLSNIGSIGGVFGVPVILPPEIVIGALGRVRRLPRFKDDTGDAIVARKILQVVWSADHRIVDGATLSKFSNFLKTYLETPDLALLDLL